MQHPTRRTKTFFVFQREASLVPILVSAASCIRPSRLFATIHLKNVIMWSGYKGSEGEDVEFVFETFWQ